MSPYSMASVVTLCALGGICAGAIVNQYDQHYAEHPKMMAPCADAFSAFFNDHPECDGLGYEQGTGFTIMCGGRVGYVARDLMEGAHSVTSFIYEGTGNHQQGVCDCGAPRGFACQPLN